MKRRWSGVGIAALATVCVSCGTARKSEPVAGPFSAAGPSAARGEVLFDRHCGICHPQGEGGLAPSLNDKPLPKFLMRFQVRHGLGAMPKFTKEEIKDEELEDILNYLVQLRRQK